MASNEVKDAIAREIAFGIAPSRVAAAHDYTPAGLRNLLKTPEMQQRIDIWKEHYRVQNDRLISKLMLSAEEAVHTLSTIARDPNHKDALKAATWILDKLQPPKQTSESTVNVNLSAELVTEFRQSFERLRRLNAEFTPIEDDPHLLEGEAALVKPPGAEQLLPDNADPPPEDDSDE